jgi:hypothetical protein
MILGMHFNVLSTSFYVFHGSFQVVVTMLVIGMKTKSDFSWRKISHFLRKFSCENKKLKIRLVTHFSNNFSKK